MDIKEIALRIGEEADEYADDKLQSKGEFHPDWHTVRDEYFAEALIAEIAKQNEPVAWWNGKETAFFEHETDGPVGEVRIPLYALPPTTSKIEQETAEAWISVDEQMPNNQQTVLVLYTTHWGKQAVTIGWHTRAKCLDASNFEGEVDDEYDEEADTYYMKEQWVDESVESEYHYPIQNVTHWMPLPKAPKGEEK